MYTFTTIKTVEKIAKDNAVSKSDILGFDKNVWTKNGQRVQGDLLALKVDERLKIPNKKQEPLQSKIPLTVAAAISQIKSNQRLKQDIKAYLKFLDFAPNLSSLDGTYSVYKFTGNSSVNDTYSFNITFVSNVELNIEDILDTDVQLLLKDDNNIANTKQICGKVFKVEENSKNGTKFMYKIELSSALKYLSLNKRYEIFHEQRASDIIINIMKRYSALLNIKIISKLDSEKSPIKEYTTMYDQSDLEFINMLCEQEGYALIHDNTSSDYLFTLCELNEHCKDIKDTIYGSYNLTKEFQASSSIFSYYDEYRPSLELESKKGNELESSIKDNAYTAQLRTDILKYRQKDKLNKLDGSLIKDLHKYSNINAQREYSKSNIFKASSQELFINDSIALTLIDKVAIKEAQAIVLKVEYEGIFPNALDEYIQEEEQNKQQYSITFYAIPKEVAYKPQEITPRPKIHSIQTAIVSQGKKNAKDFANEIDVDSKGRIRVLFHFDQNDATSCYVRLGNFYANNSYGSQFLPRVNSEVVVSFVDGDIDKPIIIGALHNGENKNPYDLPISKTKSFIKTHSIPAHKDEFGYNELAFEDKRDHEELSLRAQKDFSIYAQHDSYIDIDNDQVENILNDSTLNVNHNSHTTVINNQTLTVDNDQSIHVKGTQANRIDKDKFTTINNSQKEEIFANNKLKVGNNYEKEISKDDILKVQDLISRHTQTYTLDAGDEIVFKAPGGTMILDGAGITLKGMVAIKGSLDVSGGAPEGIATWTSVANMGSAVCWECMLK